MRKLSCVLCVVLSAWPAFAQNGSGVITNSTQRVTIATDDGVVADINDTAASTSQMAADLATIKNSLVPVAIHDQTALTTGDQMIGYASTATPTAVSTDGDAARLWVDLNGRLHQVLEVKEDTASADGDYLARIACIRDDTLDVRSGTEGDYEPCHTDQNGAIWTQDVKSNTMLTALQVIDNLVQNEPCAGTAKTYIPINISTATTTEITPSLAGSGNNYYVCSLHLYAGGADNVAITDDDSDNCASVTSGLAGGTTAGSGYNIAANGGLVLGDGRATVMKTNGTNRVICAVTSAAVQLSGGMMVVAAP